MSSLPMYATFGGIACYVIATMYREFMNTKLRNKSYYRDTMDLLNEHKASDTLLGKPIYVGRLDVFSSNNQADGKSVNIYLPVQGTKNKGEVFVSASKDEVDNKWTVNRVELEMKDKQGGTVLIFNNENTSN